MLESFKVMYPLQILSPEIIVPVTIFLIPIVAILTSHQQKMAKIIHGDGSRELRGEVEALRQEVAHLRSVVNTQTIVLDNLSQTQKQLSASQESLTTRLS